MGEDKRWEMLAVSSQPSLFPSEAFNAIIVATLKCIFKAIHFTNFRFECDSDIIKWRSQKLRLQQNLRTLLDN